MCAGAACFDNSYEKDGICPACAVQSTYIMKTNYAKRLLALLLCSVFLAASFCVPSVKLDVAAAESITISGKCPYKLENGYLKGIDQGTTVGELLYFWSSATVKSISGKALSATDLVGTGSTLTVGNASAVIIVDGDANGDGLLSSADTEIAKALLVNSEASAQYGFIVSELTGDGVISTADYLKLKHIKACKLLVQTAPATVSVPNLTGMSESEAKTALQKLGLVADVRYTTAGTAGTVAYQKISAGTTAGEGASISFVVTTDGMYVPINYDKMKGIWLYQYTTGTSLFKQSSNQRSESSYRSAVSAVVNNMSKDGFNTVFLQVRPYGDSLYPDSVYPPSPYVTSGSATNYSRSFAYDPLEIFCEIAHEKGISVHAWLNPMRLMTTGTISTVPTSYKIGQWYNDSSKRGDYIVSYGSRYYLNPAYAETRQLVVDGCLEICQNYDIDGIHFDDYFYISIDDESSDLAFDQTAFNKLGTGWGSAYDLDVRKAWRRNNVNLLLSEIFTAIKAYDERIIFGISPAGNISNNQTGYLCADVKTWCSKPGYIDYIAPQVYWSFSHSADYAKFDICTDSWADLVTCDSVKLIIGMGIYRASNPSYSSTDPDWYNRRDNIKRMLEYTKAHDKCDGWIMFHYENIYNIPDGSYATTMTEELNNFLPLVPTW